MVASSRVAARSILYSHGENSWTWPHWRTEWPTLWPASSTIGRNPRSSTWAAAARPTGPAPIIATDFASVDLASVIAFSHQTRIIEIADGKKLCRRLGLLAFDGIGAAFGNQKIHQSLHDFVIGVADQRGCLAHLRDEAHHHQRLDVMGEGGGRDLQLVLQPADRHAGLAGANQRAIDLEPGRVAQGFEVCGGVVEFHGARLSESGPIVNRISRIMEIRSGRWRESGCPPRSWYRQRSRLHRVSANDRAGDGRAAKRQRNCAVGQKDCVAGFGRPPREQKRAGRRSEDAKDRCCA